jgi:quercetin dioxygenase-like cupin family protein
MIPVRLAAAVWLGATAPAIAAPSFDGAWDLVFLTQRGPCDPTYKFTVEVRNGNVTHPNILTFRGHVTPSGAVRAPSGLENGTQRDREGCQDRLAKRSGAAIQGNRVAPESGSPNGIDGASIRRCSMEDHSVTVRKGPIPSDDPVRRLAVAQPDDPRAKHVSVVGDTYTILISGADTLGHYCLIDMLVPDGGGPPPHRHDFEEAFTIQDGELEFTFRGEVRTVKAPSTVNIPANAPHQFKNVSGKTVHMLCLCTPAGQDEFFTSIGIPLEGRDASPPKISKEEQATKGRLARELAPKYRTEMVEHA